MKTSARRKRVLILASFSASLKNFRGRLVVDLLERDHEVHVAAPDLHKDDETISWLISQGAVCHDVKLSRTGLSARADLSTLFDLVRLFRRIKPDVFLGYTIKPVIWGLIAAHISGVPRRVALITGLGYSFTGKQTGLRKLVGIIARNLYRVALKRATLVMFQNSDDFEEFKSSNLLSSRSPVEVVAGSGVDIDWFEPKAFPQPPMQFLLIARLLGDKGIREYVAAAAQVRKAWPQAQFHLVGGTDPNPDGISDAEVVQWVQDGKIVWHGHMSDVRPNLAACHVYVLPSYREGTPRTVLEAMAMGRPIITTDAPGCRDTVVHGQNGFLVPIQNASALAVAMEKFLQNPELLAQMGAHSRQIVEDKYDVRKVNMHMIAAMGL